MIFRDKAPFKVRGFKRLRGAVALYVSSVGKIGETPIRSLIICRDGVDSDTRPDCSESARGVRFIAQGLVGSIKAKAERHVKAQY